MTRGYGFVKEPHLPLRLAHLALGQGIGQGFGTRRCFIGLAEPQFRGFSHGKNGSKWIKMIGPTKMRLKLLNATNFQTLKNWLGLTMFEHF